jgi:nucleotide-binding universal stress UspA family protein
VPSWALLNPETCAGLRAAVEAFAAPAVEQGLAVDVALREGDAAGEVLREATARQADLVVLGTHGRGGFQHLVLGSVAEKVLRRCACPVLTVPARAAEAPLRVPFARLLCALDFSPASLEALRYALALAQEANAELLLLHVIEELPEAEPSVYSPLFDVPGYRRALESAARARLRALVPDEARAWCRPSELVGHGKAWREVLHVAREQQADLIAMGVQGRGALDLALFGSTAHHVIRGGACPVLTLRAA